VTARAVILGLLGAVLMGAGGQYVDKYVPGTKVVRSHLPVMVFGALIVFVTVINPLLGKLHRAWRLRGREIALILAMILVSCGIADAGLMRFFPNSLVYPIQQNQMQPGWQKMGVLEMTPPALLANGGKYSKEVVENYVTPMGEPGKRVIPITAVPWYAWWRPLMTWGGIIVFTLVGVISLSVLVHRQWAAKERIRYPLAEFTSSLLQRDEQGRTIIFRNRMFWTGVAVLAVIRLINGIYLWFPNSIEIPMSFDFSALRDRFPEFMATPMAWGIFAGRLIPACVALAFLLASDISFSLGIANFLGVVATYIMITVGVDVSGNYMTGGVMEWSSFGSFLAMAAILVYIGRRYYWQTLKQAVTFRGQPETEITGVWACRFLIVCMTGVSAILAVVGLGWPLAILAVFIVMLMFLVCARMNAECGTFFYKPAWLMPGVIVGIFGVAALGPRIMIILSLVMYILSGDPFECMMPFVANGLKVTTDTGLKVGRVGLLLAGGLLVTLAVTLPTALWADYNNAATGQGLRYACGAYDNAERVATRLSLSGELEKVNGYTSRQRIWNMQPDKRFIIAAGTGFVLLIACSAMRLRYTWWPLHPVILLGFGAWTVAVFSFSFLLGWVIKVSLTRLAGPASYVRARPLMIGVIVGDLGGSFLVIAFNWLYYIITGTVGRQWGLW